MMVEFTYRKDTNEKVWINPLTVRALRELSDGTRIIFDEVHGISVENSMDEVAGALSANMPR